MDADRLFIRTLEDLKDRVQPAPDEYTVMRIAGLTRKLLLDDLPLADEVNRSRRLKITFHVAVSTPVWALAGSPRQFFGQFRTG